MQRVRAAPARRVLLGVCVSAAAEQTSQVNQCLAALRQGLLGKVRRDLLIPSADALLIGRPAQRVALFYSFEALAVFHSLAALCRFAARAVAQVPPPHVQLTPGSCKA